MHPLVGSPRSPSPPTPRPDSTARTSDRPGNTPPGDRSRAPPTSTATRSTVRSDRPPPAAERLSPPPPTRTRPRSSEPPCRPGRSGGTSSGAGSRPRRSRQSPARPSRRRPGSSARRRPTPVRRTIATAPRRPPADAPPWTTATRTANKPRRSSGPRGADCDGRGHGRSKGGRSSVKRSGARGHRPRRSPFVRRSPCCPRNRWRTAPPPARRPPERRRRATRRRTRSRRDGTLASPTAGRRRPGCVGRRCWSGTAPRRRMSPRTGR